MKFKLCNLVSKIVYSDKSNDEVVTSVVQNTKNNKELKLIKVDKSSGKNARFWTKYSDSKLNGILRRSK